MFLILKTTLTLEVNLIIRKNNRKIYKMICYWKLKNLKISDMFQNIKVVNKIIVYAFKRNLTPYI